MNLLKKKSRTQYMYRQIKYVSSKASYKYKILLLLSTTEQLVRIQKWALATSLGNAQLIDNIIEQHRNKFLIAFKERDNSALGNHFWRD